MSKSNLVNLLGYPVRLKHECGSTVTLPSVLPVARLVPANLSSCDSRGLPFSVVLASSWTVEGLPEASEAEDAPNYLVPVEVAISFPDRWDLMTLAEPDANGVSPGLIAWDSVTIALTAKESQ